MQWPQEIAMTNSPNTNLRAEHLQGFTARPLECYQRLVFQECCIFATLLISIVTKVCVLVNCLQHTWAGRWHNQVAWSWWSCYCAENWNSLETPGGALGVQSGSGKNFWPWGNSPSLRRSCDNDLGSSGEGSYMRSNTIVPRLNQTSSKIRCWMFINF